MEIRPPQAPAPTTSAASPQAGAAATSGPARGERFQEALSALGSEIDRGEKLVKRSLSGAAMSGLGAGDLIALQAGIYRYSESVDLAGKLVDRAGNAVRTTLQSSG